MESVQDWNVSRRSCSRRMLGLWHVGLWWDMSSTPREASGLEGWGAEKPMFRNFRRSYRYGGGDAERGEGGVRGGEQIGCRREALDEGAGGGELPVLLRGTVPGLPALCRHVTPETLHPVAHAGVEPARPRQTALRDSRSGESSKGGALPPDASGWQLL
ncbi:hypothetical protein EYF80_026317 [Liparis tanakae]|uniref:Uncharacterized protein n=1 Tax=Liparis tanakae TaxID=230148 RepID=A0A4Z2HC52_9TELE|nr:hypothetical protein EYF80_026317 [Liparis tanakae]